MLNSFPEELFEFIIKHLNDNNDIYNLRLVNKNFYKLLKVVPFYRNKIHIYDIKFKPNNIRWHKLNSIEYDKQIKFLPYGGTYIEDKDRKQKKYLFNTPNKNIYRISNINNKLYPCIVN